MNYLLAVLMVKNTAEINNGATQTVSRPRKKQFLIIVGILLNVGILGYFKYYNFFIENINTVFRISLTAKSIILPLGISFSTFQQLLFLLSIYRDEEKPGSFIDFCVFVLFFPKLAAGPIVLYGEFAPQLTDDTRRYINYDNIARGVYIFAIGLFKKIVIADTIALFVDNGFTQNELSFSVAWVAAISYTLQIYFDFSGYSDMAIGIGKMLNIDLPENFTSPYKSESLTEFWRRWHITLGKSLSKLIYIPLGGSRKGIIRNCVNLFITFFISGLWHGASWTFVIWGTLHGLVIIFERLFKKVLNKIPKIIKITGTFLIVNFLWVLFRAATFSEAANIYSGMFNFKNIGLFSISALAADGLINFPAILNFTYISGLIAVLLFVVFFSRNTIEKAKTFSPNPQSTIFTVIMLCISIIHCSKESIFIYFNF